jgi:hypothetical protein
MVIKIRVLLYSTQKDLYEVWAKTKCPNLEHQAAKSNWTQEHHIEVVFTENPTSYLAWNNSPKPAVSKGIIMVKAKIDS